MFSLCHAGEFRYPRRMKAALKSLGWSKAELARRLDVRPGTVTDWGDSPPGYASAYLELALELKALRDQAGQCLERMK
jgi:ribosome-binding protein aMBF1 (putative translation factor)